MRKEAYEFFKRCENIKYVHGGCIMAAINESTGYGRNGIFHVVELDEGFQLIKKAGGMVDRQNFDFESIVFNGDTIKKIEFGSKFGEYANIYIDNLNYIHLHIKFLE